MLKKLASPVTAVTNRLPSLALPEKLRGGRVQRWAEFWQNVVRDYSESVDQVRVGARNRPFRAALMTSAAAGLYYANMTNPDERDYRDRFLTLNQDLMVVSEEVRNAESESHQLMLSRCYNLDTLRFTSLGVLTLVWRDNAARNCGLYESQCEYLQVGYVDRVRSDRLVDVGFLGKWWLTDDKMREYDVNIKEWDSEGRPRNPDKQLKHMW